MGMRAQHMPQPVRRSRSMTMIVPILATVITGTRAQIAHNVQDARKTGLRHIDNNDPGAVAKRSRKPPAKQSPV